MNIKRTDDLIKPWTIGVCTGCNNEMYITRTEYLSKDKVLKKCEDCEMWDIGYNDGINTAVAKT